MKNSYYGEKQYTNIIRLRAIENQKYLIKCSYNGKSYIISPKGDVIQHLNNNINFAQIPTNNKPTIYQKIISTL